MWYETLTINVPLVYSAGHIDFDAGKIHYKGHWKGVGPENRDFLGSEMATSEARAILAQKSRDFQGPPLPQGPE